MTKQDYLAACMAQPRAWLESVCLAYDAGNVAAMRPVHRAIVSIALRRKGAAIC